MAGNPGWYHNPYQPYPTQGRRPSSNPSPNSNWPCTVAEGFDQGLPSLPSEWNYNESAPTGHSSSHHELDFEYADYPSSNLCAQPNYLEWYPHSTQSHTASLPQAIFSRHGMERKGSKSARIALPSVPRHSQGSASDPILDPDSDWWHSDVQALYLNQPNPGAMMAIPFNPADGIAKVGVSLSNLHAKRGLARGGEQIDAVLPILHTVRKWPVADIVIEWPGYKPFKTKIHLQNADAQFVELSTLGKELAHRWNQFASSHKPAHFDEKNLAGIRLGRSGIQADQVRICTLYTVSGMDWRVCYAVNPRLS
ncbi:unnamed protein product [Mycena citricolor]|uniref:Uncharacterized protein n=1 Tax=Mycena citricolor TaxID=2018698 RepID=A0AAD2K3I9_9AGAR|nr:unnamed protein product [Mycena citricolor]